MGEQLPVVRDCDGMLVVEWRGPKPASFEITVEAFEALILMANTGVGMETVRAEFDRIVHGDG